MDSWKSRGGKSQRGEEKKREDQRGERVRRKKMQVREKVGKSRFTLFFQWFGAPEGRKVTSLKRRVRSHLARWEMKKCTPLWREAHFQVKMVKAPHVRTTVGRWDVEKVHAAVARSTFPSQNAKNTSKHTMFGPLLEVQMLKKCTPLWREAHFQVKMCKTPHVWTTFDGWESKILRVCSSFNYNYNTLRYSRVHYTTLHYTTLHPTTPHYNTLHYTTLHYYTLHYTSLHYNTVYCILH